MAQSWTSSTPPTDQPGVRTPPVGNPPGTPEEPGITDAAAAAEAGDNVDRAVAAAAGDEAPGAVPAAGGSPAAEAAERAAEKANEAAAEHDAAFGPGTADATDAADADEPDPAEERIAAEAAAEHEATEAEIAVETADAPDAPDAPETPGAEPGAEPGSARTAPGGDSGGPAVTRPAPAAEDPTVTETVARQTTDQQSTGPEATGPDASSQTPPGSPPPVKATPVETAVVPPADPSDASQVPVGVGAGDAGGPAVASAHPSDVTSGSAPRPKPVDGNLLAQVAAGAYHDPHSVLGAHPHDGGVTVRTLRPLAQSVEILLEGGTTHPMEHERDGIWVAAVPTDTVGDYRLKVRYDGAGEVTFDEPYRFLPTLGEVDLHLVAEGRHETLWTALGAHVRRFEGPLGVVEGTSFAVWAPNAQAVRVVADFNHWSGQEHSLRSLGRSGVWELFVPGVGAGNKYKFEILGRDGYWRQRADPMAFGTEVAPSTASVVTVTNYEWQDADWLKRRAENDVHHGPMSTYEVHLGSWRKGLSYRELADQLVGYVTYMGFTHVEFLPVAEHPFGGSWGYQVTSYYAPSSRFGHPDDFRFLVDRLHQAGIGVIVDWVPAHFPKDEWALARFDGEPLYEVADPRRGEHPDWGTLIFDVGRNEVRNFLVANALYWLEEYHIDGLRVDAVASMLYLDYSRKEGEWVPNQYGGRENIEAIAFLQEVNATAYKRVPGIVTIAEESTAWPGVTRPTHLGGLGFGFKWNMGWMHDSLEYMTKEPVHRQYHHHQLTFSLMYAFSENFVLPISHDEVVHGKGSLLRKMPGDRWQQLANLRAYFAFMWSHPGKQLLFMGQELGQEAEWSEERSLDWFLEDTPWHSGLQQLVRDLNARYRDLPALWKLDSEPAGFDWIDANDSQHNTFSYLRRDDDGNELVAIVNFAGVPHEGYRIGLPRAGRWQEILNTDAEGYGGSGVGNLGAVEAEDVQWHGRPASAVVRVPPLGAVWLVPER